VDNYFHYFSEIEEHFQRRRGTVLLLSTLDWALIETWKESNIPLPAVLRGIDAAFEHYERRPRRARKVNSLAYCAQEVLAAAEDMQEAAVGSRPAAPRPSPLAGEEISAYLLKNAEILEQLSSSGCGAPVRSAATRENVLPASAIYAAQQAARSLRELAANTESSRDCESLERRLTLMEERLFSSLLAAHSDDDILDLRSQADREMAPYRSKMPGPQIEQLQKQFVHKRLLERYRLPRLSLFYMP
jgi:hypothetical protein